MWRSQLWRNKWLELVSTSAFLAKVPGSRVTFSPTWVLVKKKKKKTLWVSHGKQKTTQDISVQSK